MGAKAERYNRPRKRHWHWRDDPRQLKLPFEEGDWFMPRKPTKHDDPEQSKRFIEIAEEVGADTDDEALERALKKVSSMEKAKRARSKE
jgi:hypothetical protein